MNLHQIETLINSPDPQERMRAITELRHYTPEVVVPLLKKRMYDQEFVIRSFVAMGLGYKQTEAAFTALLELLADDRDSNVRAEAANSLAKYGDRAIPHLAQLFARDSHWLVRQSILAALEPIDCPEVFLELCLLGIEGQDPVVQQAAIANLSLLQGTSEAEKALEILLSLASSDATEIRAQVARVLIDFDEPRARAALMELRNDTDYRVLGATLEGLIR